MRKQLKAGEINQGVPDEHNGRQEVKLRQRNLTFKIKWDTEANARPVKSRIKLSIQNSLMSQEPQLHITRTRRLIQ